MSMWNTPFAKTLGIEYPIICGPMYPCSNPELVAAASEAGGIGIIQPVSMEFVHRYPMDKGMELIRSITKKPVGMNALIEDSSKKYFERVKHWLELALEHDIKFFITSLGNPRWVVDLVKPHGGVVYHDVTNRRHAEKGIDGGVDGLICVNNRAGGHAGHTSSEHLYEELADLGVPLICAGGISTSSEVQKALSLGYQGVQLGTRFIATQECTAHAEYKRKIVDAGENDIVLTERLTGVPVAVIRTPYIDKIGTKAGPLIRWMLKGKRRKKIMRTILFLASGYALKRGIFNPPSAQDYLQAGKSVEGIHGILSVKEVFQELTTSP